MGEDITNMLIEMLHQQGQKIDKLEKKVDEKIEKLENKVDELIELKNKLIAAGVVLSMIFGFLWDFFKSWFSNRG